MNDPDINDVNDDYRTQDAMLICEIILKVGLPILGFFALAALAYGLRVLFA